MTALVIGFLGLVWKGISTIEDLRRDTNSSLNKIMTVTDVYGRDLAELRANQITQTGQVASIVLELNRQHDEVSELATSIQQINDRLAALPKGTNLTASAQPPKHDLVIPKLASQPTIHRLDPEQYQELIKQRERSLREQIQTQQQFRQR